MTESPAGESSLTTAPSQGPTPANVPVIITDDPVITDDSSLSSGAGTLLEAPIPVQVASKSSLGGTDPIVDTVLAASVNHVSTSSSEEQVENGTSPGQTAMIVVLAVAAAAVGAAFVSHKIYSGGIRGASGSSAISENSWMPAGGAVGGSAPHAKVQGSTGINV